LIAMKSACGLCRKRQNQMDYPRLLGRLLNRAHLVTPDRARLMLGVLASRAGLSGFLVDDASPQPEKLDVLVSDWNGNRPDRKIYRVDNGMAILPVSGTLVSKLGTLDPWSGMTGYDGLMVKLGEALVDDDVKGIAFDFESPGGEVHSQLFELADMIAGSTKPTWAICSDYAYSAAYWLASQCDHITVPPNSGGVGSVGAVCLHTDMTKAYENAGVKVTVLRAGARKMEANPYEELPPDVAKEIEAELEVLRISFAEQVAKGRGIGLKDVLATEARTINSDEALKIGFADDLMTPSQAFAAFAADLSQSSTGPVGGETQAQHIGGSTMAQNKPTRGKPALADDQVPDDADAIEDDEEGDGDEAPESGKKPSVKDDADAEDGEEDGKSPAARERKRIAAIIGSKAATGRADLAQHFAFNTSMSVKDALAALAHAPKAGSGLADAMASAGNPDLSPSAPTPGEQQAVEASWASSFKRVAG
jgi:ClpP class serine protease